MSQNKQTVLGLLEEIQHLMELKGENPFKVRAFQRAIQTVNDLENPGELEARARAGTLTELSGIGKGIAEVLREFLLEGKSTPRDQLLASLPAGLMELIEVPGLGPKKAQILIEELGIQSLGELEYACRENRLLKLKGFGEKIQDKILEGVQFLTSTLGQLRISEASQWAESLLPEIAAASGGLRASETGALRRKSETVSKLEFIVERPLREAPQQEARVRKAIEAFQKKQARKGVPVEVAFSDSGSFGYDWAQGTGSEAHWRALGSPAAFPCSHEGDFFERLGLPFIPPEMRETGEEVKLARLGALGGILAWDGIRGIFHNHTTASDGASSLEEMVSWAEKKGYEYIGISDHSQSAFYAQGLKLPELLKQEREVREAQERHPKIRIFWGIESDILADGSLDYDQDVLRRFDFVIASVHSRFKMDRETMTLRICEALQNPCTRFLGHATGRLLLGRKGYDLDMERVIEAASRNDVSIEINANPARLDIDWRWGPELRKNKAFVSVNPDAHDLQGLDDTRYGVAVARKALLPSSLVINSRSVAEVEKWLKRG